jgi:hypothetical protein
MSRRSQVPAERALLIAACLLFSAGLAGAQTIVRSFDGRHGQLLPQPGGYLFEDIMKTKDTSATFEYGRPMKGHGWHPMSNAESIRIMAEQVRKNKP